MEDDRSTSLSRAGLLRRAGALGLAAAVGGSLDAGRALAAAGASAGSTIALTPEQEEGPFYVAIERVRKNITLGKKGVPLDLEIKVLDTTGKPLRGAACDIWQCDATGVYSDESSESTVGQTYLRGVQFTDAAGVAKFTTVYPGFYQGRTTHIHVKVHVGAKASSGVASGGHVSHTGQILFDDAITTKVNALAPYTSDTASRTLNTADHVYTEQGGPKTMLKLTKVGATVADGFRGTITLVVSPQATPAAVGVGGHP
jgi:protocatechuate 3,4-dioxygenase beta subunit